MNRYGIQQKNTLSSFCEEMRNTVSMSLSFDKGDQIVCPKPRRLGLFDIPLNEPVKPLRWHMCNQPEPYESKAGLELLEIIFEKGGGYGASDKKQTQIVSSPPFFTGSPPSRVSNPLTQDNRFRDAKTYIVSDNSMIHIPSSGMSSSPSIYEKKEGPSCGNFGNKPAIRIEGFDCRVREECHNRNCGIPTLA